MFGRISRKDLVRQPVASRHGYGWQVLVVAVLAHKGTFLELVCRDTS